MQVKRWKEEKVIYEEIVEELIMWSMERNYMRKRKKEMRKRGEEIEIRK